jgi:hypothetical protein
MVRLLKPKTGAVAPAARRFGKDEQALKVR